MRAPRAKTRARVASAACSGEAAGRSQRSGLSPEAASEESACETDLGEASCSPGSSSGGCLLSWFGVLSTTPLLLPRSLRLSVLASALAAAFCPSMLPSRLNECSGAEIGANAADVPHKSCVGSEGVSETIRGEKAEGVSRGCSNCRVRFEGADGVMGNQCGERGGAAATRR